MTTSPTISDEEPRTTASVPHTTVSLPEAEFISCEELYELIERSRRRLGREHFRIGAQLPPRNPRITIFDVRPPEDYADSRIKIKYCLNILPEEITASMTGYYLEELIRRRTWGTERQIEHTLFYNRSIRFIDVVVLVDWGTTSSNFAMRNLLNVLKTILQKKDPGNAPPRHVVLDGGFKEWLSLHPELTTNPETEVPEDWEPEEITQPLDIPDCFVEQPIKVPEVPVYEPRESEVQRPAAVVRTLELLADIEEQYDKLRRMKEIWMRMLKDIVEREGRHEPVEEARQLEFEQWEKKMEILAKDIEKKKREVEGIDKNVFWLSDDEITARNHRRNIKALETQMKKFEEFEERTKEQLSKLAQNRSVSLEEPLASQTNMGESQEFSYFPTLSSPKIYSTAPDISSQQESQEDNRMDVENEPIFAHPEVRRRLRRHLRFPNIDAESQEQEKSPAKLKITPGTTGITNNGNSCYVNTVLQCLAHLDQLKDYFLSDDSELEGNVCEQFKNCMQSLWSGKSKKITEREVQFAVAQSKETFRNHLQQDCHEFLTALLELMHDELKEKIDEVDIDQVRSPDYAMNSALEGNSSIISDTFYGQVRSKTRCNVCGHESVAGVSKYDVFTALNVPLPDDKENSLKECIQNFFDDAEVEDWNCQQCGEKQKATRMLELTRAPPVLIVQLVRYIQVPGGSAAKNTAKVEYPMQLKMVNRSGSEEEWQEYSLRGISCHLGRDLKAGHYVAYCKNSVDDKWYKFDDDSVTPVPEKNVLQQNTQVYLLFYSIKP